MRTKKKHNILNIAQGAIILALLVFIILMVGQGSSRDVPMDTIAAAIIQQPGLEGLSRKDAAAVNTSFHYIPSDYIYYKSEDIMDVRELFIAKAADDSEMENIEEHVAQRLSGQIDNFTGYGTNQLEKLQHAIAMQKGNYYFYGVGEEADAWQAAFLKLIG